MERNGQNFLSTQKIQILKKLRKKLQKNPHLHHFTQVYQKSEPRATLFLRYNA